MQNFKCVLLKKMQATNSMNNEVYVKKIYIKKKTAHAVDSSRC